jgi:hypothetical protein
MRFLPVVVLICIAASVNAQENPTDSLQAETIKETVEDSTLRITNLNPYMTVHVDSTLNYNLDINRPDSIKYFWYLRNSPVGLKLHKDYGQLTFKADKSFFLSGKLRYDQPYNVLVGVQNVVNPLERFDTSFTIVFYSTEIIPSRVKPSVSSTIYVDEGDTVSFKVQCEVGNFPIENITFFANTTLKNFSLVKHCDDEFTWIPPYEFVKESDSGKVKSVTLSFVGANKFLLKDTAQVRIIVRDALNYPLAVQEHNLVVHNINSYILQLKYTFVQLDKSVKKTKSTRTTFDITSSTTALTGSILTTSNNEATKKTGQILPSVGVSLVPIKEAVAPQKVYDQNQASVVRTSIKRLEYMLRDNSLLGERDFEISKKTSRLREELKQVQIQLIDIPIEITNSMTEKELNEYFNSPKVNKKYRVKK